MTPLVASLTPCGPVIDHRAADRAFELLSTRAGERLSILRAARLALDPVFGASPYLAGLARRDPTRLLDVLQSDPEERLRDLLVRTAGLSSAPLSGAKSGLRLLKAEAHLLIALADLGGVWGLDQVTAALAQFADAALQAALTAVARDELAAGRLLELGSGDDGPVPGFFCIAMGKHGAFELNYSSDIDISVFYDPDALLLAEGVESQMFAVRLTQRLAELMQDRTPEGYVFRVDLRLRPDPSSTPPAVPVAAAMEYYEAVGQNWERAAFIKARICAGDRSRGAEFLRALQPFIWRKSLDFAAIADIHSIKRQIHIHKVDDRLTAKGMDLKLGRGGIREIEFYVQTQQLILGGRHPGLRSPRTLDALAALNAAGYVSDVAASDMRQAYETLRNLEHRIQMLADEQTHRLPESDADRKRVAALAGEARLQSFDARVVRTLKAVNRRYGELFPGEEALSSRFGSLIFTGVEDDPETLSTLNRMGFSNPGQVSQTIRSWHHGHIAATRSERGRELFTRLAPRLLDAVQATGSSDIAFIRFSHFFSRLSSGVQLQSLFLAQPKLFELIVQVLAYAPRLAEVLARRPSAIDSVLDGEEGAGAGGEEGGNRGGNGGEEAGDFEVEMDHVRRTHGERAFRVGVRVLSGASSAEVAGRAFAQLADRCITTLAPAALAEVERVGGAFAGGIAVVALGKCGSSEMNAGSDLDLMTYYDPDRAGANSLVKGWSADVFYGRFTQRLIAALSASTGEGGLYEVDMQLRPSGTKGPLAVSRAAFEGYYEREAETWELLALTRARVVWADPADFGAVVQGAIEAVLRRPVDPARIRADALDMRRLMARERPAKGDWDLKRLPGGLIDIEFAVQVLQLVHAAEGGPLRQNTGEALAALHEAGLMTTASAEALSEAWRLQQDLTQVLKLALTGSEDLGDQPKGFKSLLAKAGGARDLRSLKAKLGRVQRAAHRVFVDTLQT